MTGIWDRLVGQDLVVAELSRAVADAELIRRGEHGPGMTHAWLVTGPPGSGRSTAATCFAAALVCPEDGCGVCEVCRTAPLGGHADVDVVTTETLSYSTKDARDLVVRSSMAPIRSPWHVIVMEDADRLTEQAVNVLLKSLEEPPPHTVWVLCAPSVEDVLPTIVSRTRLVPLRTPSTEDVAELLVDNYGVDIAMASFAARASQGHIGRARALARDEHARMRRQEVLRIPFGLQDVATCFTAASNLLGAATDDAKAITDPIDEVENQNLLAEYGDGASGITQARLKRMMASATKDLTARQKTRRTRTVRDQVDRALLDLMGLYRDVLVVQVDGTVALINEEMRPQLSQLAARSTQNDTGRRLQAISYCRQQIGANVTPQLALESLMVELKDPWIRLSTA
jgi:DNA polymerase III subunit delta'